MVKFGMKSTLIQFKDKYYKYNGAVGNKKINNEDIGLAIEGYESAFLACIVASYLFKMTAEHFTDIIIQ
eukprot:6443946-Ditylum_brightwellii.AAC.1